MGYARGTRWTDELIEQKILEVVEGLGLDRMPFSIGEKRSKYHKYRDRFELIEKAVSFWSDLSEQLQLAYPLVSTPVSEIKKE